MINKKQLQQLANNNKSTYQIANHFKCSQTNIRYYLRKYGLTTKPYKNLRKKCLVCKGALKGKQRTYCSQYCKSKNISHSKTTYIKQMQRGLKRKKMLIDNAGGKCSRCNYSKNYAALCFHHVDPNNKVFELDVRKCSNTNLNSLLLEASKCDLLCHNCHMEIHHPQLSVSQVNLI